MELDGTRTADQLQDQVIPSSPGGVTYVKTYVNMRVRKVFKWTHISEVHFYKTTPFSETVRHKCTLISEVNLYISDPFLSGLYVTEQSYRIILVPLSQNESIILQTHQITDDDFISYSYQYSASAFLIVFNLEVGRFKVLELERIYQNRTGRNRLSL